VLATFVWVALTSVTSRAAPPATEHAPADTKQTSSPPASAPADEPVNDPASGRREVHVEVAPDNTGLAAQRALDRQTPGFATAIDLETQHGARPSDGLPELLTRTAGVHTRSYGGLGSFTSISIRGSTGQQVAIFLDGAPLTGSMSGVFNLSDQPLDALHRVEVYRGHVPIEFGGAAIGGAVNLISARPCTPRTRPRARISAGVGSFAARQAAVSVLVPLPKQICIESQVSYAGADGSFEYYNTANTPLVPEDDVYTRRRNNHYNRVQGRLSVSARRGRWRLHGQQLAFLKGQGVPGHVPAEASRSRLESVSARTLGQAHYREGGARPLRVSLLGSLGYDDRRFSDPADELGNGADRSRARVFDLYLSPRARLPLWRGAELVTILSPRLEWAVVDERVPASTDPTPASSDRVRVSTGAGLALEQLLIDERLLIAPAFNLDVVYSYFQPDPGARGELPASAPLASNHSALGLSPRLGLRHQFTRMLQVRGSVGRYFRAPSMLELFGAMGYVNGNPALQAERGTAFDAGLVVDTADAHAPRWLSARLSAAGFATWYDDLIQSVQAGPALTYKNLHNARVAGLEAGLTLALGPGDGLLHATYTFLDSRNDSQDPQKNGQPLPGRPRHSLFTRLSGGHEWRAQGVFVQPRVFYTLDLATNIFLDESGRRETPIRPLHGLGGELHLARRWHFALEIRNLLNARTTTWSPPIAGVGDLPTSFQDWAGYPIPGRSVWATLRIDLSARAGSPRAAPPQTSARARR
jgi:iron complex outermembrane receptor protein